MRIVVPTWALVLVCAPAVSLASAGAAAPDGARLFLPTVHVPADPRGVGIWPVAETEPPAHEVALFRARFQVTQAGPSTVALFADTRYEAYLDGDFTGRGPARFTDGWREADHYRVDLAPGDHVLAVLVQWAPNTRRSRSVRPLLVAEVRDAAGQRVVATSPAWRATLSPAWLPSGPVAAQGLIGPQEVLDLRQLPRDWTAPAFDDAAWPQPVTVPAGQLFARSIPPLAEVVRVAEHLGCGWLAPGRAVGALAPGPLPVMPELRVETLAPAPTLRLPSGEVAQWQPLPGRPDALVTAIAYGPATAPAVLEGDSPAVVGLPASARGVLMDPGQPGPRLLLAEPVPDGSACAARRGPDGWNLTLGPGPSYALFDLGRTTYGRLRAAVQGASGARVSVGWDERLLDGRPLPHPGSLHPGWSQVDEWVLDDSTRDIATIDARAGRYVIVAHWGSAPVTLSGLEVLAEGYPGDDVGSFTSSDRGLDQIWRVGADTLRANMTDAYADPWRERGQWWGDAYVDIRVNRAVRGDTALWRRGLLLMAREVRQGRPPVMAPRHEDDALLLDFGLLWLLSLDEYTGLMNDPELLAATRSTVEQLLTYTARFEDPVSGLLSLGPGGWWQKALIDWAGQFDREGEITALNALYAGSLDASARLAERAGDGPTAEARHTRAAEIRAALNERLYVPSEQRYATSRVAGRLLPAWPHAQAWALAYDVPPESARPAVADALVALTAHDPAAANVEIYGMFWVLEALGRAGRTDDALALVRALYGTLVAEGATTWPEVFAGSTRYTWSLSHGWGGAPTWYLTTYVLGAEQVGPRRWRVAPAFAGVTSASGTLALVAPQPAGAAPAPALLSVAWSRASCASRTLVIGAPTGTSGQAVLSALDPLANVTLDDRRVLDAGRPAAPGVRWEGADLVLDLRAGDHTISAAETCPPPRG